MGYRKLSQQMGQFYGQGQKTGRCTPPPVWRDSNISDQLKWTGRKTYQRKWDGRKTYQDLAIENGVTVTEVGRSNNKHPGLALRMFVVLPTSRMSATRTNKHMSIHERWHEDRMIVLALRRNGVRGSVKAWQKHVQRMMTEGREIMPCGRTLPMQI